MKLYQEFISFVGDNDFYVRTLDRIFQFYRVNSHLEYYQDIKGFYFSDFYLSHKLVLNEKNPILNGIIFS